MLFLLCVCCRGIVVVDLEKRALPPPALENNRDDVDAEEW